MAQDFALHSPNFYGSGGEKCEILPQFSTQLPSELPSFRNGATYLNSERDLGAPMIDLCPAQIWDSSILSYLRTIDWFGANFPAH